MSWLGEIGRGLLNEFTDLPSAEQAARFVARLLVAAVLGGMLGYEREQAGKAAGLRTHMLVALGAAFFTLIPVPGTPEYEAALSRVLQGLVAGIGFLGAGAILKQSEAGIIRGLTTAASIWFTAAVGASVGAGRLVAAVLGTVLALVVLAVLGRLESRSARDEDRAARPPTNRP
jgi:putative Mg2+ transporter-C (MgtC) family protein